MMPPIVVASSFAFLLFQLAENTKEKREWGGGLEVC